MRRDGKDDESDSRGVQYIISHNTGRRLSGIDALEQQGLSAELTEVEPRQMTG
jgi:hypothetical protein